MLHILWQRLFVAFAPIRGSVRADVTSVPTLRANDTRQYHSELEVQLLVTALAPLSAVCAACKSSIIVARGTKLVKEASVMARSRGDVHSKAASTNENRRGWGRE